MGRFRVLHDDDEEDEPSSPLWEFVAEQGEEGAVVVHADENRPGDEYGGTQEDSETRTTQSAGRDEFWWRLRPHGHREAVSHPANDWEWVDHNTTRQKPRSWWLWILSCAVLLVALLWKDPPPAPPPPPHSDHDTAGASIVHWRDYLVQHGQQLQESVTALGLRTPSHVLSWLVASVAADLQLAHERFQQKRKQKNCNRSTPQTPDLFRLLRQTVVGQPLALELATEAIHARGDAPLVLWAAGYPHTGKRTFARQLAASLVNSSSCVTSTDVILQLKGGDWRIEEHYRAGIHNTNDSSNGRRVQTMFRNLVALIDSHVQQQHGGLAVIVLTHVEEMEAVLLKRLLDALVKDDERPEIVDHQAPATSNLREACRNTIIYITCSSKRVLEPITRSLRLSGEDLRDAVSLPADLRVAVRQSFDLTTSPDAAVATILPFGPFTPEKLAKLLRRRVDEYGTTQAGTSWKGLQITDAAVDALLDPTRIEYLEWRAATTANSFDRNNKHDKSHHQDEPKHFLTVALEGAKVLDDHGPVMTKIYAQTRQMVLQQGAQPDKMAVLDYDKTNPFVPDSQRGILKWCDDDHEKESSKCRKVLQFRV